MSAAGKKSQSKPLSPQQEAFIKQILGIKARKPHASKVQQQRRLNELQQQLNLLRKVFSEQDIQLTSCTCERDALQTVWERLECRTVVVITIVNDKLCLIPQVGSIKCEALGREVLSLLKEKLHIHGTPA